MSDGHVVLLWPDRGQSGEEARGQLGVVAAEIVAAAWDPDAEDGGRTALLASVRDARDLSASRGADPDALTLVGFGRGAVAAAGLTKYAKRLGIGLGQVWCVGPTWDEPDPFSGAPLKEVPEGIELVPDAAHLGPLLVTCQRPR